MTMRSGKWSRPARGASSAPGVTRTRGQRFRKPLLYPSELQGLNRERRALRVAPVPARTTLGDPGRCEVGAGCGNLKNIATKALSVKPLGAVGPVAPDPQ